MSSEATSGGLVEHVQCGECRQTFPVYVFVADTDMATSGWVAFTGIRDKDIVLAQCLSACSGAGLAGLVGPGYRHVEVSFQAQAFATENVDFQHFLGNYVPLKATYECIYCGGRAFETHSESQGDFMVHGKLAIRNGP